MKGSLGELTRVNYGITSAVRALNIARMLEIMLRCLMIWDSDVDN